GYVAPWWDFSNITNEFFLNHGFKSDHSLMHNVFTPFFVGGGDGWSKFDYILEAKDWMKPLIGGLETNLVKIPATCYLNDLPPM
ncbi:polysaccharide deacetylase, partial [Helicobacter pylori]